MKRLHLAAGAVVLATHLGAQATEVAYLTEPTRIASQKVSTAADARAYRIDAARHIYASYASRIYKGRLPPLIHGVVVVETTVDASGQPREVKLVRGPSHAPDVSAAVIEMIRRAGPLPAPSRFAGPVRFTEIWLVHKDGRFQLDALTEGQD
ncbi:MAG TPA: energy transducer TonB [Caldimonas sp.]|jgi:TonB family protein|nr:energy transducer TonB [Caldimonas sp.]